MGNFSRPSAPGLSVVAAALAVFVGGYAHAAPPAPTVTCTDETTTVTFKGNPTNVHISWSDAQRLSLGITHEEDPAGGVHEVSTATPTGAAFVSVFVDRGGRNITLEAECTATP